MWLDKLFPWLSGKAGGLGAREAQPPSLAMNCRLFQDVDMLSFTSVLEEGSLSYLEFLTVPPAWDGQLLAPAPQDLRLPPTDTYVIAVVDLIAVGFSRGQLNLLTVFSDAGGQRCTKHWSVEIRTTREQSMRALFMVPPGAAHCETHVAEPPAHTASSPG
jgi:hypothetical protein